MRNKAIIIGGSTTGKSTLLKNLRENTDFVMDEMDELLTTMNGGIYPKDGDYRHKVLYPKIVKEILAKDHIVFLANTHIFTVNDLEQARKLGFLIIQLFLSREEMEYRNKHRMENKGWEDISMFVKYMIEYQEEIKDKGLVDKVINANQPVENIARELLEKLST